MLPPPIALTSDMLPISAAASELARRIEQTKESGRPIIITQRGYPSAVIMSVEQYEQICAALEAAHQAEEVQL